MTRPRTLALTAALFGLLAAPAFAQTGPADADADAGASPSRSTPPADTSAAPAPMPDTGMKHTVETPKAMHHHARHHARARTAPETTPPATR